MSPNTPNSETSNKPQVSVHESSSARLFQCACCHVQLKICSCCDRGHVYCTECADHRRRDARRDASKRYQASLKGRLRHAARQRRYRERTRLRKEKVTHQGCGEADNVLASKNRSVTAKSITSASFIIKRATTVCDYCAQPCSPFLRREFLQPGYQKIIESRRSKHNQLTPDTG